MIFKAFFFFFLFCGLCNSALANSDVTKSVDIQIKDSLYAGAIAKFELAWVSENIETPVAIDSKTFDNLFNFSFQSSSESESESIVEAIKNSSFSQTETTSDIRWRLNFFNKDGYLLSSIYLSQYGNLGYFQGKSIKIEKDVILKVSKNIMKNQLDSQFKSDFLYKIVKFFK
ncbi:hypothetical protein CIK05_06600 [Bdellovibrio sp. qaytius]|nr:hypothetical protein CIK05_06600 [Bdellovibrio sp. qaytius]